MAKKKKTREQKILAEIHRRQQLATQEQYSLSARKKIHVTKEKKATKQAEIHFTPSAANSQYEHFLKRDLRKTLIVTTVIIILQLVLYRYLI